MRYTISDLTDLMPPPQDPVGAEWSADQRREVEGAMGTTLPADYWDYVAVYGQGTIDDRFRVVGPFPGNVLLALRDQFTEIFPFIPGTPMLPFGENFERGVTFWERCSPDPALWTVSTEFDEDVQRFKVDMTTFLVKCILREILSTVLYNELDPFRIPVSFYPTFDPARIRVALAASDRTRDEQNALVLNMFGSTADGREIDFGAMFELQARVPRSGWSIRYRSYRPTNEQGAAHELELAVPHHVAQYATTEALRLAEELHAGVLDVVGPYKDLGG